MTPEFPRRSTTLRRATPTATSSRSRSIVTIDLFASRLPAPLGLASISLNGAVQLAGSSNAVDASHGTFDYYRVYSTAYDGTRGVCTADWVVEGSTVSDGVLRRQPRQRRVALLCGDGDQPRRPRKRLE